METLEVILNRKSVRSYKKDQIAGTDLEAILDAGKSGPGSGAYHLSVIQNSELIHKINTLTKTAMLTSGNDFMKQRASLTGYEPIYGAPTLILLSAADPNGIANTSCSAENMLIAATALGLGSCYLMSPRTAFVGEGAAELLRECGIPEGYTFTCAVIVGYKDGDAFQSSAPKIRTVSYVK